MSRAELSRAEGRSVASTTIAVTASPGTVLALKRAIRLYESIAAESLRIHDNDSGRQHEPDKAVMRDTAEELHNLMMQLELRVA